jgi:hypothetical protein
MSLRSSGLRWLERHEPWLGSVKRIVEALHLKIDDALAFTPSLDFCHIGGAWKFTEQLLCTLAGLGAWQSEGLAKERVVAVSDFHAFGKLARRFHYDKQS